MFDNIGEKIKKLAETVCWIGIIGSVTAGVIMLTTYEDAGGSAAETAQIISGIVWMIVGSLASWIGSFLLYGFGELISSQKNSERYLAQLCKDQSPDMGSGSDIDTNADTVTFGTYPQTKEGTDNTPIEWNVLERDGDKALLISKYALDSVPYNSENSSVAWETCSLRKWLNNDFFNRAFGIKEKKNIVGGYVLEDKNPVYNTNPGDDTKDKVFLLSISEVNKYFKEDDSRMCAPTDYAVKNGAYTNSWFKMEDRACGWWWLRSPGDESNCAAGVDDDGSVDDNGDAVSHGDNGVRPCMWVRLS